MHTSQEWQATMGSLQRMIMRKMSALNVGIYRRSKGRRMGTIKGLPVLLLTVKGRKSGAAHTTPVVYLREGGSFVVIGSAGGAPSEPQWFRNLRATNYAAIQVGADSHAVSVTVANRAQRERLWQTVVIAAPFFGGYQSKTTRIIPIAVLTPKPV